jgi:hypothetical protein
MIKSIVKVMEIIKDWFVFWIWMFQNARYDRNRGIWIATGFRRIDSRLIRKYGVSVIFTPDEMCFEFFHELGHHVMNHCSDCGVIIRDISDEMLADEFAADIIGVDCSVEALQWLRKEAYCKQCDKAAHELGLRIQHLS